MRESPGWACRVSNQTRTSGSRTASLAALITAGLLLLARLARLGFLADFISRTVLIGFLTGVGIQVALGQLGGMLGVATPDVEDGFLSDTVLKAWDTLGEIPDASLTTVAVSIGVIATLLVFGRWFKAIPGGLVAVVGAIAISWGFDLESHGVAVLGSVPSGLPSIGLPSGVGWSDVVPLLGTSVSMVLVILAQSAATSRAYAIKYQERFVENNDLVGLSVANLAAGFSGTFPVNGSPTKTEMADEASSKTQVAMIAMAVTVAIVLLFLTKPLQYMPNAVLSAVVFLIGVKLVKLTEMAEIRRLRVDEFVIATITAVVVVTIGVEQGIILAIVLSLLEHVRRHYDAPDAVVQLTEQDGLVEIPVAPGARTEPGLVVYRFGVGLFYANTAKFSADVLSLVDVPEPPRWLVLLADAMDDVDFTGGKTLLELAEHVADRNIVFCIAAGQRVLPELERFGVVDAIGLRTRLRYTRCGNRRVPRRRVADHRSVRATTSDAVHPMVGSRTWRESAAAVEVGALAAGGDPPARAGLGEVVPARVVLDAAVVPQCQCVGLPLDPALEVDAVGDVVEEHAQQCRALGPRHPFDPVGEPAVHVERRAPCQRMSASDRMHVRREVLARLVPVGAAPRQIARVDGVEPGEELPHRCRERLPRLVHRRERSVATTRRRHLDAKHGHRGRLFVARHVAVPTFARHEARVGVGVDAQRFGMLGVGIGGMHVQRTHAPSELDLFLEGHLLIANRHDAAIGDELAQFVDLGVGHRHQLDPADDRPDMSAQVLPLDGAEH